MGKAIDANNVVEDWQHSLRCNEEVKVQNHSLLNSNVVYKMVFYSVSVDIWHIREDYCMQHYDSAWSISSESRIVVRTPDVSGMRR